MVKRPGRTAAMKRPRVESTASESSPTVESLRRKKNARLGPLKNLTNRAEDEDKESISTTTEIKLTQSNNRLGITEDQFIEDVVSSVLSKKKAVSCSRGVNPVSPHSSNLLHYMNQLQMGQKARFKLQKSPTNIVIDQLSELELFRTASPFNRRATTLEWHPTNPDILAVGSKGGEILVWNFKTINKDILLPETGPGGSIQALKFVPRDHGKLITASIDGTVSIHNLNSQQKQVFMDTMNCIDDWYCSLDVHQPTDVATVGDNHGNITLRTLRGAEKVFSGRLHKNKVTHIEYSKREPWLFATASTDQTVQLWDIRMLKGRESSLALLKHDKPVNSVYFSLCSGTRLATTDQQNQIRIYNCPTFQLAHTIEHPHRHFRHITPHKAFWHPLCDMIVVGRYPDEKFPGYTPGELRTIDMFDAETGKMVYQLHDPQNKGIISLNKFSHNGDYLASTMGVNVLIWSQRHDLEEKQRSLLSAMSESGLIPSSSSSGRRPRGNSTGPRKQTKDTKQTKQTKEKRAEQKAAQQKLKTKVTTNTKGKKR